MRSDDNYVYVVLLLVISARKRLHTVKSIWKAHNSGRGSVSFQKLAIMRDNKDKMGVKTSIYLWSAGIIERQRDLISVVCRNLSMVWVLHYQDGCFLWLQNLEEELRNSSAVTQLFFEILWDSSYCISSNKICGVYIKPPLPLIYIIFPCTEVQAFFSKI